MKRVLPAVAALLLLGACATRPELPGEFAFAVLGDTPYNEREERQFLAMMARLDAEDLAFVLHVGDFKAGSGSPCTDALYERRHAQLDASRHPLVLTPGDNDWTDCRRKSNGATDPLERLARLRQVFFSRPESLGRARIATAAQTTCIAPALPGCGCAAHPENRSWSHAGVRFVTLNVPGSENNVGFDAASDAEARCRNEANRQWLEKAVRESASAETRALVVAVQANPWDTAKPVYLEFIAQLEDAARRIAKPMLFVHGDSHTYRVDAPFTTHNPRRLETFGSPFVGWVKVIVDPAAPEPFRFEPHLQALVPPGG